MLPVPAQPIPFRTFPDPRIPAGNHFRFIVSSCTTPNFPYAPMKGRRIKGYDMLAEYLWPTSPVDKPIPAEVLEVEDILLGKDIPEPAPQTAHVVVDDEAVSSAATEVKAQVPLTPNTNKLEESLGIETAPAVAPPPADFMMFLGDFVYADVPVWWGDGALECIVQYTPLLIAALDREAYRRLYRRNYNSPSFRKIYEKLR
jgi:alkaline phosphatase D